MQLKKYKDFQSKAQQRYLRHSLQFFLSEGTLCTIGLAQFSRIIRQVNTTDVTTKKNKKHAEKC